MMGRITFRIDGPLMYLTYRLLSAELGAYTLARLRTCSNCGAFN